MEATVRVAADAAESDLAPLDKSELLRDALHRHLVRLESERDVQRWESSPLTEGERSLADVAEWGPAEDWSDWADAAR